MSIGHGSAQTYLLDGATILAADAYSSDAECCVGAILTADQQLRPDLGLEVMGNRVGHVDRLWLNPAVRGRGLGLLVLQRCTQVIARDCAAVVIHPAPTEPDDMTDAECEAGRRKLYAYWRQAGFVPVPDDAEHLYLDPAWAPVMRPVESPGVPPDV